MNKQLGKAILLAMTVAAMTLISGNNHNIKAAQSTPKQKPELVIQNGHSAFVTSVSFSPDGIILASGSGDGTIKLWLAKTGRLIRTLVGHSSHVFSVSFSPDGRTIASGSDDKTIKLWEVNTGRLIRTFEGHSGCVYSVSFSPDGRTIASGSDDKTIKLWEVNTGRLIQTLEGNNLGVNSVSFSPDGKLLVSGEGCTKYGEEVCSKGTIKLWEVTNWKLIRTLEGHSSGIDTVSFSPDGITLASGSQDNTIKIWSVSMGKLVRTLKGHSGLINAISFSPDGKTLASGSGDKTIKLWDVRTGRLSRTLEGHAYGVDSISFTPDGMALVSAGPGSPINLWEIGTGRILLALEIRSGVVETVSFSPDGRMLATGNGSTITLWETGRGRIIQILKGHSSMVWSVSFSPDGKTLASGSGDKTIKVWDVRTGRLLRTLEGHSNWVEAVSFSPDGKTLASGSGDKTIKLWDVRTGRLLRTLEGHSNVEAVSFSPDGKTLASGSGDKTIKVWDARTGRLLRTLEGHSNDVEAVSFSPDGKKLASGSMDNTIKLWDVVTGKLIRTFIGHSDRVCSISFGIDGRTIFSGSRDRTVVIWDVSTGRLIRTIGEYSVSSLSLSSDGKTLVSGSWDSTIKFWSVRDGRPLLTLLALDKDDWIVYTDDGYFDTSPNAKQFIGWTVGMKNYSFEQFWDEFYQPGLFSLVMSGQQIAGKKDLRQGFATPPDVRIISPKSGETIKGETAEVTVQAVDSGGGVEDIRLYHNGSLVGAGERGIAGVRRANDVVTKVFKVTLMEGENTFRATAYSGDRLASAVPYEIKIRSAVVKKRANLFLVAVGINDYKTLTPKLTYSRADAEGIVKFFKAQEGKIYEKVYVKTLYDQEATKANILDALKQPARPQDVLLIYFAGHGIGVERKYYFMPYDIPDGRDDTVKKYGLSHEDIMGVIGSNSALKRLLLLDTCESGTMVVAMRGLTEDRAVDALSKTTGSAVISAANETQGAGEAKEYGHGFFTFAILDGVAGGADQNHDGIIGVFELLPFVKNKVTEIAAKYGKEQSPKTGMYGDDFPLAVY